MILSSFIFSIFTLDLLLCKNAHEVAGGSVIISSAFPEREASRSVLALTERLQRFLLFP